jgi:hypothetical protein
MINQNTYANKACSQLFQQEVNKQHKRYITNEING